MFILKKDLFQVYILSEEWQRKRHQQACEVSEKTGGEKIKRICIFQLLVIPELYLYIFLGLIRALDYIFRVCLPSSVCFLIEVIFFYFIFSPKDVSTMTLHSRGGL